MTRKAWLLLIGLGVLWGIPYLLIRIAVTDFHPVIVAFFRAVLGAMILLPFALRRKGLASGFSKPLWLVAYTVAEISGPWFLIGSAELHVTSSLAGLIIALTPAIATVIGIAFFNERLVKQRILGLCLGFAGVVAVLGFDGESPQLLPVLALCLSALGYAVGPIIVASKLSDVDTTAAVVASLIVSSAIYAPFVPMHWPAGFSLNATLAVVALAIFCTAMAFQMFFALVSEVGPARATVVTYINPAVAALLGVVVLNEPFSAGLCLGFVLILAGSYFSTWGQTQRRNPWQLSNDFSGR
ncbi:MAG TPA: DMT family transporter [Steroidobacteraceae bacterium]|nr:DMT family transporter [Steroidobacteraceae bacterium]